MTNIIRHKRTEVPGAVPHTSQLLTGELAINAADGKIFTKTTDGEIIDIRKPMSIDGGEIFYNNLLSNLKAFWLLDETTGNKKDSSPNNIPLFPSFPVTTHGQGLVGSAIQLADNYYYYAVSNFSNIKSISFWIKPLNPLSNTSQPIVKLNNNYHVSVNTTSQKLEWHTSFNNTPAVTSGEDALTVGAWTHVVLVYDSVSNQCLHYENGSLVDTISVSGTININPTDVFYIQQPHSDVDILLDCMGVWERALSLPEIQTLYGNGSGYGIDATDDPNINYETAFINVQLSSPLASLTVSIIGSTGQLYPTFSAQIYDYCILSNTTNALDSLNYTITANGTSISNTSNIHKVIRLMTPTGNYHIRLLPSDMPLGTIVTKTQDHIPGYYVATSRREISAANYNIIYDDNGVPVWYVSNAGLPHLHQPGNDNNIVVAGRRSSGTRFLMTITNDAIESKNYEFLPVNRNGTTYTYDVGNHEFLHLSAPPSRRGNVVFNTFAPTPSTATQAGQDAITNKAYGVYVQEQKNGVITWDWWTSDHFNVGTLPRNASFFHMNSVDVHPINGDMVASCRQCSAVIAVDYTTKKVKWVIQGPSQPWGGIAQTADPVATADTKFLTLEGEPIHQGFQYMGPVGQHHAKWCPYIKPLTPGNEVVSIFDNQPGLFTGSAPVTKSVTSMVQNGTTVTVTCPAHGTGTAFPYVKIQGASPSYLNGDFAVTVVDANTFTYSVTQSGSVTATGTITATLAAVYWPNSGPSARGVVYEIDLNQNKAIHRCSIFSENGRSGYLGSYQVMHHPNGVYSHVLDFNQQHPIFVEYGDAGDGTSPTSKVFEMDIPGDNYRVTKVPKEFFNIEYMRATASLPITVV